MTQGKPVFSATVRAAASLFALGVLLAGPAQAARPADKPTPSGLPVPRWVSLKFDKVNARSGPGDDHRLVWVWRAKGLPLQVVAETREWRKVCDPDGSTAWVHRRTVDGVRKGLNAGVAPLALRSRPRAEAGVKAWLAKGAAADLDRCEKGWCRVKVADRTGWTPQASLWGGADAPQCR